MTTKRGRAASPGGVASDAPATPEGVAGPLGRRDYAGAMRAAAATLAGEEAELAAAAARKGNALLEVLVAQANDEEAEDPPPSAFKEPLRAFRLALKLQPGHPEAKKGAADLDELLEHISVFEQRPKPNHSLPYDVVIVGAGAAGVGVALTLTKTFGLDPQRVVLVERGDRPGETFRRWPKEMRFISPSFNHQGWSGSFDLNSVMFGTSPAHTLGAEHPSGEDYAFYLGALAHAGDLNIMAKTEVTGVRSRTRNSGFWVDVAPRPGTEEEGAEPMEPLRARYVIWAAGEFQYPKPTDAADEMFPGEALCRHNSSVRSWKEMSGDDYVVIGGYESGMDAAFNLAACGKKCTVAASTRCWTTTTDDPSTELAPYTVQRINEALEMPTPPRLLAPLRVTKVEEAKGGAKGFLVHATWGEAEDDEGSFVSKRRVTEEEKGEDEPGEEGTEIVLRTPQPPILCTGFEGSVSLGVASALFEYGNDQACNAHAPVLTDTDQSTITPGLFLVGSLVQHGELSFCFVYKFRQRFGVVANAIAQGLGYDTRDSVQEARQIDMFMDDFTNCQGACGETC